MKPSLLKEQLKRLILVDEPVIITGPPGCGKSDVVEQAAEELGAALYKRFPIVDSPTDTKGLGALNNDGKTAYWAIFEDLKILVEATELTVYCLEDLGSGVPAATQAVYMQQWLGKFLAHRKISPMIRFVSTTNRREDRAGVTSILEPLKGRATILQMDVDTDDWCKWAIQHNMPEDMVAYIRLCPEALSEFAPTPDITNSPTPRNWAVVGKKHVGVVEEKALQEVMAGRVGKARATGYWAFRNQAWVNMPNLDAIILNPSTAQVPDKSDMRYVVGAGLAKKANPENFESVLTYMKRIGKAGSRPVEVACVKDAISRKPELQNTSAFVGFCLDNSDLFS